MLRKIFRRLVGSKVQTVKSIINLLSRGVLAEMVYALVDILRLGFLGEVKVLSQCLFNHLACTRDNELIGQIEELGRELRYECTNRMV